MTPQRLFRALAVAETVTWTLLLLGMFGKYVTGTTEAGVRIGGGLHGFAFLSYCAATILIGVDQRWTLRRLAAGLGSAFVPFLTVPFERSTERAGQLSHTWRLVAEQPRGVAEQPVAWALRSPVLAGVLVTVALGVVFTGLLMLGPPTEWGRAS